MTLPSRPPQATDALIMASEPPAAFDVDPGLAERFGSEVEACVGVLSAGIVHLEAEVPSAERWQELMRSAHSLKGAARVVGLMDVAKLAHALEDYFVATREQSRSLQGEEVDRLLETVDLFQSAGRATSQGDSWTMTQTEEAARALRGDLLAMPLLANRPKAEGPAESEAGTFHFFSDTDNDNAVVMPSAPPMPQAPSGDALIQSEPPPARRAGTSIVPAAPRTALSVRPTRVASEAPRPPEASQVEREKAPPKPARPAPKSPAPSRPTPAANTNGNERVLRVAAESIERLMGLAGESLVESRRVLTLSKSLLHVRREHRALMQLLTMTDRAQGSSQEALVEVANTARALGKHLGEYTSEFDDYMRRVEYLGERLYREALKSRMRPFSDGSQGLPRLVRDVSRKLNKQARLVILGEHTEVDRDVLEVLDAPLNHILRNAVDHGIEEPGTRTQHGKPATAQLCVEARHQAGMLAVTISDDGRGIDPEKLRRKVVEKGLSSADAAASLTPTELYQFLFLPGFSTAATVSEISGRGVGLDVVRTSIEGLGGTVNIESSVGKGTTFKLLLPVTRSVLRALVTEVDGDAFAFPLLRIERIDRVPTSEVRTMEGQRYVMLNERPLTLVSARMAFGYPEREPRGKLLNVVVLSEHGQRFGMVVDEFRGERDLVVRPLDSRLGKIEDIAAAAVMSDGSTALIVDVDDLARSVERLLRDGRSRTRAPEAAERKGKKRVLVVDDSITVREAEKQVLTNRGYHVDVAVDGFEGLHAAKRSQYDLIVTDIDMPRMNGLELVRTLKADEKLKTIPIIIVSYKNREEDRQAGLAAGAEFYLNKSSFHDDRLVEVIGKLLGESP
jgi:two-component system sensor histidine kinase and response regulator WspE